MREGPSSNKLSEQLQARLPIPAQRQSASVEVAARQHLIPEELKRWSNYPLLDRTNNPDQQVLVTMPKKSLQ